MNTCAQRKNKTVREIALLVGFLLTLISTIAKADISLITLSFETASLDLATGTNEDLSLDPDTSGDIRIAYNADRSPHAVVVISGEGILVAVAEQMGFDGVTQALLAGLSFSDSVDLPFDANRTVVIRTAGGSHYKLGNASENIEGVTFNFSVVE